MMKRFIQVGCGGFGAHWLNEVWPRLIDAGAVHAAAAVDLNPKTFAAAQARLRLPAEKCYTDLQAAFAQNKNVDFAVVVVPPKFHEAVVDAALAHNLDILSEKPVADTMEACCRIFKKVRAAGRKMAVTMSHRFDQDKQSLEAALRSGRYGPLNYVVYRFTHNCRKFGSWGEFRHRIPDPLLIEGAVHHFDILRALCQSNARTVHTLSWNPPWGDYAGDSTALIAIEMENGTKCLYEGAKANASTLNGWGNDYIRAECRDATLELDRRWLRVLQGGAWDRPLAQDLPLLQQPVWKNAWLAELFVNWLNGGAAPPNSLDDNLHCCALLFAAIESAHARKPVDVKTFLEEQMARA